MFGLINILELIFMAQQEQGVPLEAVDTKLAVPRAEKLQSRPAEKTEQQKRHEKTGVINTALDTFDFGDGGGRKDQWSKPLSDAFKDPKGSITEEREELLEPVSVLAGRAFNVFYSSENMSSDLLVDALRNREQSRAALRILFERYPGSDFSSPEKLKKSVEDLIRDLKKIPTFADFGTHLASVLDPNFTDITKIQLVDFILDGFSKRLYDENIWEGQEGTNQKDRSQAAPFLKKIDLLRANLCFRKFGTDITPEEIIAIRNAEIYAKEAATQATSEATVLPMSEKKESTLSFEEVRQMLNSAEIKNPVEDARRLVTPEVKAVLLKQLLVDLDDRIRAARTLEAGTVLGLQIMGHLTGITADTKVYRLPLIAAEGRLADSRQIKITDYFNKVFGHDLLKDRRARDLTRLTNIFD
jgi:hypothetical protein